MLLGVHCSVAGGLHHAFDEANELGINTFQIFTKNQRQWKEKIILPKEATDFRARQVAQQVQVTFSHSTYLINLASGNPELLAKSYAAIVGELQRCDTLGLAFTVLHPGSAKDLGEAGGIQSIADQLNKAFAATKGSRVKVALENTAGQGASIGRSFEQLAAIAALIEDSDRIGFCFDTCHAFAAGYDIRTKTGFEDTMAHWDKTIGLDRLSCLHLNDSKGALGSHLDRHEHIGYGQLGDEPFRQIMQQFPAVPKVVETPKKDDWDSINLNRLRSFTQ